MYISMDPEGKTSLRCDHSRLKASADNILIVLFCVFIFGCIFFYCGRKYSSEAAAVLVEIHFRTWHLVKFYYRRSE